MNDNRTEWTKRKTDGVMDYLAEEIIATLTELSFDETYIKDTRRLLVGKNRFDVLLWCNNNLDSKCMSVLADKHGVNVDDLIKAIKIISLVAKL